MSRTTAPAATVLHPCSARSRCGAGSARGGFCVQSLDRRLMLAAVELDQGFGTPDGIRALEVPGEVFHGAHDLVVLPGGKMVTAGRDDGDVPVSETAASRSIAAPPPGISTPRAHA